MSAVKTTVSGQEAIDRAAKLLSGVEGGIEKALREATKHAVSRLRSASAAAIREEYAISAANIRAEENVSVKYSYLNGVQATVTFAGRKIPLYRFDGAAPAMPEVDTSRRVPATIQGRTVWVHPGVAASGHQKRGTPVTLFRDAFVAQMDSGHVGIFERTGGMTSEKSEEIRELMGSSVPQMLGNQEVAERLTGEAMKDFEKDLDRSVLAILSGYMR